MKVKHIFSLLLAGAAIVIMSHTTGTTSQAGDATGSPLASGQTCFTCHNTGATRPVTIMYATEAAGGPQVTSFVPGKQYAINFSSAQPTILYPTFGFQACVLTSDNQNAGTITAATQGSTLTVHNGITYLEHTTPLTTVGNTARVRFVWTAPNTDKAVTIYAAITQSNENGGPNGDVPSHVGSLKLTSTVGVQNVRNSSQQLIVYPNPATSYIVVELPVLPENVGDEPASVDIYDLAGKKLYSEIPMAQQRVLTISTDFLKAGNYFLSVNAINYRGAKLFSVN